MTCHILYRLFVFGLQQTIHDPSGTAKIFCFLSIRACDQLRQEAVPTPVLGTRESNKKRSIQEFVKAKRGALLGEFFVDGLDEFGEVKGFFEDATGTKEFCNVEEVAVALRAGHGDDLRVEILPRQL